MNVKNNQRVRLTRSLLKNAYIDLMQDMPVSKITVRALCDKAQLNRTTFYLHYGEPNEVLIEIENDIIEELNACLDRIAVNEEDNIDGVTGPLLSYVRDHDKTFCTMLIDNNDLHFRNKLMSLVIERVCQVISIRLNPRIENMVYEYAVQGCMAALTDWIRTGYQLPMEEMNRLLTTLTSAAIQAGQLLA